jgi:hypothetical protein
VVAIECGAKINLACAIAAVPAANRACSGGSPMNSALLTRFPTVATPLHGYSAGDGWSEVSQCPRSLDRSVNSGCITSPSLVSKTPSHSTVQARQTPSIWEAALRGSPPVYIGPW